MRKNKLPNLALQAAALQQHAAIKYGLIKKPNIKRIKSPRTALNSPAETATIFTSKTNTNRIKEYEATLTLAERTGLVQPPNPPLSDDQFENVKKAAQSRGFFEDKCPICYEKFGPDNLVLLSCSHLVHQTCLINFRKFVRENPPKCPVCRSVYQFIEVRADQAFNERSAKIIQRNIRGFLLRNKLGEVAPPGSSIHKKWAINQASKASEKLASVLDAQNDYVDAMLGSVEVDLEWSRSVVKALESREKNVNWKFVKKKVEKMEIKECPICLRECNENNSVLTSCGHLFHENCFQSWSQFCRNENKEVSCPVCRAFCSTKKTSEAETEDVKVSETAEELLADIQKKMKDFQDLMNED